MIVVFSFLTLLIGGIHSIAWFVRVFPEPEAIHGYNKPSYNKNNNNKSSTSTTVNPTIVAAIAAAVNEHRRINKQK
jgi:Na+-transporting methylmalonyl-CoA/oxaloacetate decarboxylase gamma subunit